MRNRNGNNSGMSPAWWMVLAALAIGLIIPDKYNPLSMIFKKKETATDTEGK